MKPFKDDPAKQERFEQFLKEKYKGGLRTTDSNRVNSMSESARAQERLDFEAAAEAIEKGKAYKEVRRATEQPIDFLAGGLQFTSGGTEVCLQNLLCSFHLEFQSYVKLSFTAN